MALGSRSKSLQSISLIFQISVLFLAAVVKASPPGAISLTSQCWTWEFFPPLEAAVRSCSIKGPEYLDQDPGLRPELFTPSEPANQSEFTPWTYRPVCTSYLPGANGELCVYTSTTFGRGRGISIMTTPKHMEEILPTLALDDPDAHREILEDTLFEVSDPGGYKGKSGFATRDISRGEQIGYNLPIIMQNNDFIEISYPEREDLLRVAFLQLPLPTQKLMGTLTNRIAEEMHLNGYLLTHGGFFVHVQGMLHYLLFPEMGYFNHHCAPNAQYGIDRDTLAMKMTAARGIPAEVEISISYSMLKRHLHFEPHAERMRLLDESYGWDCDCSRCKAGDVFDSALERIKDEEAALSEWVGSEWTSGSESVGSSSSSSSSEDDDDAGEDDEDETGHRSTLALSTVGPKDAVRLIKRYKLAGLQAFLDIPYGHAALAFSAVGDEEKARRYAQLATEKLIINGIPLASNWSTWRELAEDPTGHWSWRRRAGAVEGLSY